MKKNNDLRKQTRERVFKSVFSKPWSELRIICEGYTGYECCCATRHEIVDQFIRAREKVEQELIIDNTN